jgi:hypothetical protein
MSAPSIASRGETRSATTPPASTSAVMTTLWEARTSPRSVADPVRSRTAKASATGAIPSPIIEVVRPRKSRR